MWCCTRRAPLLHCHGVRGAREPRQAAYAGVPNRTPLAHRSRLVDEFAPDNLGTAPAETDLDSADCYRGRDLVLRPGVRVSLRLQDLVPRAVGIRRTPAPLRSAAEEPGRNARLFALETPSHRHGNGGSVLEAPHVRNPNYQVVDARLGPSRTSAMCVAADLKRRACHRRRERAAQPRRGCQALAVDLEPDGGGRGTPFAHGQAELESWGDGRVLPPAVERQDRLCDR